MTIRLVLANLARLGCRTWNLTARLCPLAQAALWNLAVPIPPPWENSRFPDPFSVRIQVRTISLRSLAAGLGFEPRYTPPEGVVLPLDDPAMF